MENYVQTNVLNPIIEAEMNYSCCMRDGNTNCYNSNNCVGLGFLVADKCHAQQCCGDPSSYPNCAWLPNVSLPASCTCVIQARPCCYGLTGQCMIQSEDYCNGLNGVYHSNALLCSDVNCMADVCGLGEFSGNPNQAYRVILGMFLSVGVLHLLLMLFLQVSLVMDLEYIIGGWRFGSIYLFSGAGGYSLSALITPFQVSVGPSPCLYGMLGCYIVQLFLGWELITEKKSECLKLFAIVGVSLFIGTLPYIDNVAHIGALLCGVLSSIVFLPVDAFRRWSRRQIGFVAAIAFFLLFLFYLVLTLLLNLNYSVTCSFCNAWECIAYVPGLCDDVDSSAV